MKRVTKRIVSMLLALLLLLTALPLSVFADELTEGEDNTQNTSGGSNHIISRNTPDYMEISDGYVTVKVSVHNGGFYVGTAEGDVIVKSDDNKDLVYSDDDFDTSFTSFRIKRGEKVSEYIFGRSYAYLGIETSAVNVYKSADNAIVAEWQVDGILFKQTIALMGADTYQHGMAYVAYSATNVSGEAADSIEARVLMDTALGSTDYGYYMLGQNDGSYVTVEEEKSVDGSAYSNYFFAYDNKVSPTVTAYLLNGTVGGESIVPQKVTFAHWLDLASTIFEYTPSEKDPVKFTEVYGSDDKLTADSAVALYYDLGAAPAGAMGGTVSFYYGVYSNYKAGSSDIAVNFTSAGAMFFNDEETAYKDQNGDNAGNFSATIKLSNIADTTFGNVSVAIYPEEAISLYNGSSFVTSSMDDPYFQTVTELKPGETRDVRFDFNLEPTLVTSYRRIRLVVYNANSRDGFTDENRIVEKEMFVLCPGMESAEVGFTGMTPASVFMKGKRFAYITGTNFSLIRDTTQYRILLRPADGGDDVVLDMDKVVINPERNTATLILDMELRPTTYDIILDWNDTTVKDMKSDVLRLMVTDIPSPGDPGYISSGVYGIITVERDGTSYEIVNYDSEEAYNQSSTAPEDIMLVLRGDFNILSSEEKHNFKAEAVTLMAGEVITVNDCLEVREGRVTLTKNYDDDGNQTSIDVDIDGKLYTAVANTKVWDGVLAVTSFKEGNLYTLPVYNEQGKMSYRKGEENGELVRLLWPGAASVTQTIAGLLLNFRYGEFAFMEQGESLGRVMAFGAALDPSVLVPPGMVGTKAHYSNLEKKQLEMGVSAYTAKQLRATDSQYAKDQAEWRNKQLGTLNLYMDDILFGAGGFIGFNTEISVGIPSYAEPLPYIEGTLSLKVINDYWEFGVEGSADMKVFEMEATLKLKSYKGIPIPDEFYFFIGGVKPGVPVDPFGVFWVRGAGAGIGNIYKTFFGGSPVPPLTLMISGEFAIFSALSARADLEISARGFSGYLNNVGVAGITIIDRIGGSVYWYPDLSISFAIRVDILDCIVGEGGIILKETDDGLYFCGYAKATVKIPDKIWFVGGTEIGSASIGVDTEKVWGSVKVIGVGVGIRYYWGKDVEIDVGKVYDVPTPVMRRSGVPIYTDSKTGDTLYMSIQNDVMLLSDASAGLEYTQITTSLDGRSHSFTLDPSVNEDALMVLTFRADNAYMAQDIKNSVKVKYGDEQTAYKLEWFVSELAADHELNAGTNAMFRYDEESGLVTVSISVTDSVYYGSPMTVSADGVSEMELFGIGRLTSIDTVEANESLTEVTLTGSGMHKLSKISLYAEAEDGTLYRLAEQTGDSFGEDTIILPITLPMNLPTGAFTLKAIGVVLDASGNEKESPMADGSFDYVNPLQPAAPEQVFIDLTGDYTVTAQITASDTARDGYLTSVYEVTEDGHVATVYADMATGLSEEEGNGAAKSIRMGGQYTTTDDRGVSTLRGLEAGKTYVVSVQSYKDMEDGSRLLSTVTLSNEVIMSMPILVEPTFSIDGSTKAELGQTGVMIDTVKTNSFTLNVTAAGFGDGTYTVNDGEAVAWDGKSIVFENMEDGFYTVSVVGTSTTRDAFNAKYQFSIDTLAPSVLLTGHEDGGFFSGNSITMKGTTEGYSKVQAFVEGVPVATAEAPESGEFSIVIPLDESLAYQDVKLYATDRAGNVSMPFGLELTNSILGEENLKAVILQDGKEVKNIVLGREAIDLTFAFRSGSKYVTVNEGSVAGSRIRWSVDIIQKDAEIDANGRLTGESGAGGIVLATLEGKTAMAELVRVDLSTAELTLASPEGGFAYTGFPLTPKLQSEFNLEEGLDYTIQYVNNTNAGLASAIITATENGQCTGTRVINFAIARRDLADTEIMVSDGGERNPDVLVTLGEYTLVRDVDYTVTYKVSPNGKEVIVTLEGIGNFDGLVSQIHTVHAFDHWVWIIPTATVILLGGAWLTLYLIRKRRRSIPKNSKESQQPIDPPEAQPDHLADDQTDNQPDHSTDGNAEVE